MSLVVFALVVVLGACQKLERPVLKELILDPPPPPYSILKSYWSFDTNLRDTGQYRAVTTATNVTLVPGISGQAAKIGAEGYLLVSAVNDSLKTPGSLTVAFWMNGVGPVVGGAQGLFAIGNSAEFWGNFEMFLENNDNGAEAFLKIHMYNYGVASGNGEEWNELKLPNTLNKWSHIAVTYNAATSQIVLYKDGQATALIKYCGRVLMGRLNSTMYRV